MQQQAGNLQQQRPQPQAHRRQQAASRQATSSSQSGWVRMSWACRWSVVPPAVLSSWARLPAHSRMPASITTQCMQCTQSVSCKVRLLAIPLVSSTAGDLWVNLRLLLLMPHETMSHSVFNTARQMCRMRTVVCSDSALGFLQLCADGVCADAPALCPAGKKPHRYDYGLSPSYARLVNFTERLWDYDSCAEAQLKIWLARHLLASENSGNGQEALAACASSVLKQVPAFCQRLPALGLTCAASPAATAFLWHAACGAPAAHERRPQ